MDPVIKKSLELLEGTFHLVLHCGMESEAFRGYKEFQDVLLHVLPCLSKEDSASVKHQLERFDWDALNLEIQNRASLM
jgi:hypothetical protein